MSAIDPDKIRQVKKLKAKAKKLLIEYNDRLDCLDCGASMAAVISPAIAALKKSFNETMDELSKIDPSCPSQRLL